MLVELFKSFFDFDGFQFEPVDDVLDVGQFFVGSLLQALKPDGPGGFLSRGQQTLEKIDIFYGNLLEPLGLGHSGPIDTAGGQVTAADVFRKVALARIDFALGKISGGSRAGGVAGSFEGVFLLLPALSLALYQRFADLIDTLEDGDGEGLILLSPFLSDHFSRPKQAASGQQRGEGFFPTFCHSRSFGSKIVFSGTFTVFGAFCLRIMLSIRVRLLAFLVDLSLGHLLFHYSPDFFSRILPSFLGDEGNPVVALVVMLLIPTFIIRFYGTLLWGVSPGQWLCSLGVRPQGGRARLLGSVRVFSEIVGIPFFFIFQAPLLWGGESWGERLSGTRLFPRSPASMPVQLLTVSVLAVVSTLVPLLQYFIFSETLEMSFVRRGLGVAEPPRRGDSNIYSSNRFRFQTRSVLNEERFVLLPDFELIKIKTKKRIRPLLVVYDRQHKKVGRFKFTDKVDLLSILGKGRWGNPLFQFYYPKISQLVARDRRHYARMPYLEKYDGNPLIDVNTQKEIKLFIEDVLNTKFSKIGIHLISKGPFARGYREVKRDLLDLVRGDTRPEASLHSLGDQGFLRFRQVYSMLENPVRDAYVPLGTGNAVKLRIVWEDGTKEMEKIFLRDFFHNAKWYFDFDNIFSFPVDGNRLTPFHIIDYFIDQSIDEEQRKTLENYLLKFYRLVSKEAIERGDSTLETLLLDIFDRYRFVARTDHLGVRKGFVSRLDSLEKALKLQEFDFFEREL